MDYERDITNAYMAALSAVPGLSVSRFELEATPGEPLDATADVVIQGETTTLLIEAKKSLFPRDIPNIIWRLKRYRDTHPKMGSSLLVLLAEAISPGARDELQSENVGYFDSSGSLFLPAPNAYVFVDRPPTKKQEKVIGSVFEGRKTQVLEALWEAGHDWSGVKSIAERTGAAPSLVSATLQELERHEWVEAQGSGPSKERRLSNWEALLDAWTDHELRRKPIISTKFYVPNSKPAQIAARLDSALAERGIDYEITGELAGNAYASLLSTVSVVRARVSHPRTVAAALEALDARPVAEGWNLATIDAGSDGELRFRQRINNQWFASPLRTYLDLLRTGGRGQDAAKMLREQKLHLQ